MTRIYENESNPVLIEIQDHRRSHSVGNIFTTKINKITKSVIIDKQRISSHVCHQLSTLDARVCGLTW